MVFISFTEKVSSLVSILSYCIYGQMSTWRPNDLAKISKSSGTIAITSTIVLVNKHKQYRLLHSKRKREQKRDSGRSGLLHRKKHTAGDMRTLCMVTGQTTKSIEQY